MGDRPVVDFDHHSHDYAADSWSQYADLRAHCPVAWSEAYGGFWVTSRYDDVATVSRDDNTFSSRHDNPNDGVVLHRDQHPRGPNRSTPIEMDSPEFPRLPPAAEPALRPAATERLRPL